MTKTALEKIRSRIRDDAARQGFGDVAFTAAAAGPAQAEHLEGFIARGFMGDMDWIADTSNRRRSPVAMWEAARTAIVLVMNYGPDHDPMETLGRPDIGNISVYARGRDYHDVIKGKLKQIAGRIASREGVEARVFVDTAPLMEKPLAARGGLGWQGKHTNLVSRDYGSWLFLGVILTDADWAEPAHGDDHCGSCTKCLDICPTDAFPEPYRLDARRCISYLTIEHKGVIPPEFRRAIGNRIFGCDDCLAVCPWNRFAAASQELKLKALPGLTEPQLSELLALDEAAYRKKFAGTPVRRTGYERFMRNVIIAVGNSDNNKYINKLKELINSKHELISAHAIGALKLLMPEGDFAALRAEFADSASPLCRKEWQG
jgi:epoxyqueuosine reductase